MKKVLFMMSLLLTLGMFSACSSDGEMDFNGGGELMLITDSTLIPDDGVVLRPYEFLDERNSFTDDEEMAMYCFFYGQLPIGKRSTSFFVDSDKDECYVINSLEELKIIYCGEKEIPYIDFDKYTLVIGQMVEPNAFYPVFKQELKFNDNKCRLTLYVPELDEVSLNGVSYKTQYLYHWALYPKFNTAGIIAGIVKEGRLKTIKDVGYKEIGWLSYELTLDRIRIATERTDPSDPLIWYSYYPMNLPDEYKVEFGYNKKFSQSRWVSISGYIFETVDDMHVGNHGPRPCNYIYLTDIEETECPLTKEFAESIGLNWDYIMGE